MCPDLPSIPPRILHHRSSVAIRRVLRFLNLSARTDCTPVRFVSVFYTHIEESRHCFAFAIAADHHDRVANLHLCRRPSPILAGRVEYGFEKFDQAPDVVGDDSRCDAAPAIGLKFDLLLTLSNSHDSCMRGEGLAMLRLIGSARYRRIGAVGAAVVPRGIPSFLPQVEQERVLGLGQVRSSGRLPT